MTFFSVPALIRALFPRRIWKVDTQEKELFLTFDDGPVPDVTAWVLDLLQAYNAKATFFCVGENVQRYPQLYHRILQEGHRTGNHTFNHLDGWKTDLNVYLDNIYACSRVVDSSLFRPPYGKMSSRQAKNILKAGYKIVMWTLISYDFDKNEDMSRSFKVVSKARPGSIIVFHDNIKAVENLKDLLPRVLTYFQKAGYRFSSL